MNSDLTDCVRCGDSRFVPHPDTKKADFVVIACPECSQITEAIRSKYLADPTVCPWCGGPIQADSAPDVDEGKATQEIDCLGCGRAWHDVYRLVNLI